MDKLKNKNAFLITCVSCILLILLMLYLGINTNVKGTRAAIAYTCNGVSFDSSLTGVGDIYLSGSDCLVDLDVKYDTSMSNACSYWGGSGWSGTCTPTAVYDEETGEREYYSYDCTCSHDAVSFSNSEDDGLECYGCFGLTHVWSDYIPSSGCITGWYVADDSACSSVAAPTYSCYCFNGNTDMCDYYVNPPGENYKSADDSACSSVPEGETKACYCFATEDGYDNCEYLTTPESGMESVDDSYCEGGSSSSTPSAQCYQCNSNSSLKIWTEESLSGVSDSVCPSQWHTYTATEPECITRYSATFMNGDTQYGLLGCTVDVIGGKTSCSVTPQGSPTKSGHTFAGWGDSDGCTSGDMDDITLTSSKTYYACWTANSTSSPASSNPTSSPASSSSSSSTFTGTTFTAKFYNDDGTKISQDSCTTTESSPNTCRVDAPTDPTKSGYTFTGWSKDNCATKYNESTVPISGNRDLYPCWTENSTPSSSTSTPTSSPSTPTVKPSTAVPTETPTEEPTSVPSTNVTENPPTGDIAMFVVWVIALASIVYSVWYFKGVKQS